MGVFVCCLLLLLDTRAPPRPGAPSEKPEAEASRLALERTTARADYLLSRGGTAAPTNVSGYYHGDWTRALGNASADKGMAVLQLEMLRVPTLRSVSVVRGLVVFAAADDDDLRLAVARRHHVRSGERRRPRRRARKERSSVNGHVFPPLVSRARSKAERVFYGGYAR
ncbi:MAG: hypothetical protein AAFV49_24180, partial [Pseudomonadota bacterium]